MMTVLSARLSVHVQKMDTPDEEELQNDLESQDYNANETPHETLTFAPNLAAGFDELKSALDCFQKANLCRFYVRDIVGIHVPTYRLLLLNSRRFRSLFTSFLH